MSVLLSQTNLIKLLAAIPTVAKCTARTNNVKKYFAIFAVMQPPYLFMLMLGGRPKGRLTEQHDIFFGIGASLKALAPAIKAAWPEAKNGLHIDAWRHVTQVNGYNIRVIERHLSVHNKSHKLFFINLGGYKPGEFDELHYKLLAVAANKADAIQQAKQTAFYKHMGFKGAASHIDNKYGVDVDDLYDIEEILSPEFKERYALQIIPQGGPEDAIHPCYLKLTNLPG